MLRKWDRCSGEKEGALICVCVGSKWGSSGRSVQRIAARQEKAGSDRTQAPVPMEISRKRPPGQGTIRPILTGLLW